VRVPAPGTLAIAFAFVAVFVFWWQDSHASPRSPLPEVAACIGGMWGCYVVPLRWLTIFGVAIETAGIEKHFARPR